MMYVLGKVRLGKNGRFYRYNKDYPYYYSGNCYLHIL
jgi:hypothetical protein